MKLYVISCLLILAKFAGLAQTISGKITDKTTGETLIGATVYDKTSNRGVTSNGFGFFSLALPKNEETVEIECAYLGYTTLFLKLQIKNDTTLQIKLSPSNNLLNEVVITGEKKIEDRIETGVIKMTAKDIDKLPQIGGEADVMKAFQLTPGVKSGGEGTSGMYVRGGSPDQNLMLLDDVPLYYVNHMGGFVSTFNADAINSATLIKGGFPARYGSRLSSVMDIRTIDGNKKEHHGSYNIGSIAVKASVQGPIKKDTSSYFISFRRLMYDIISRPVSKLATNGKLMMSYSFYDFNSKFHHQINQNNQIHFAIYSGRDRINYTFTDKESDTKTTSALSWGNLLASLRLNHIFNSILFSNTTLYYTQYFFNTKLNATVQENSNQYIFQSGINDLALKSDFDIHPSTWYVLRTGYHITYHLFNPSSYKSNLSGENNVVNYKLKALETSIYIENELKLFKYAGANIGLRQTNYCIKEKTFSSIEPRLMLTLKITEQASIKLSYAEMKQFTHMLTNSGQGMPTSYWLPSTNSISPEYSKQVSIGYAQTSKNNNYEWSIEAYKKNMSHLIEFKDGIAELNASEDWQNMVEKEGVGTSKGIELFIKKKKGKSTGWIGYTLSKTDRTFSNLNNGITFPFKYDSRHDINIVFEQQISKKIHISAVWVFSTGNTYTLEIATYRDIETVYWDINNQINYEFNRASLLSSRNEYRMRDYHRLDLGLQWTNKRKRGIGTWNFSIYNVYNRLNPFYYEWRYNEKYGQQVLKQFTLFPIFPSIGYKFEW